MKYIKGFRSKNKENYVVKEEVWEGIIEKFERQYENGSFAAQKRLFKYLNIKRQFAF